MSGQVSQSSYKPWVRGVAIGALSLAGVAFGAPLSAAATREREFATTRVESVLPSQEEVILSQIIDPSGSKEAINPDEALSEFEFSIDEAVGEYIRNYPITAAINQHIVEKDLDEKFLFNYPFPGRSDVTEPTALDRAQTGVQVGALGPISGSAVEVGVALTTGHKALALAAKAKNLKAAALAAAKAKQFKEAAALGARAKATGAKAMKLGKQAMKAAHVAKILTMVSGGLAIIDGGFNLYRGIADHQTIGDLKGVAQAKMDEIQRETAIAPDKTQEDFAQVMEHLDKLSSQANEQIGIGGAKTFFGGMLLGSPFTGPVAAPIVGGIGATGYLSAVVYENWDSIVAFPTMAGNWVSETLKNSAEFYANQPPEEEPRTHAD